MTSEANQAQGRAVNEKRVARGQREQGLQSDKRRRFRVVTTDSKHAHPVPSNILARDFEATAPNQKWLADMTYVPTDEGGLYVALGWREPGAGLIHQSDRGSRDAATAYREKLEGRGITLSMSRKGDCWDNAPMDLDVR